MSQKLRAKEGHLEMLKSEGVRKKWRSYLFKVSAQTYLLCFKLDNPAKPNATLLLPHVLKIDTSAVKDASFPFSVHFKGKGSPWILNASTNAQRMEWMEAIQPGASATLAQFAKGAATLTVSSPPYSHPQPPASLSHSMPVSPVPEPADLNASWPPTATHSDATAINQQQPQEYMVPLPTSPVQSLPVGLTPARVTSPKRSTISHAGHDAPQKPQICKATSEVVLPDDYVEMSPPPPPKPKPRPRQHPPTQSVQDQPQADYLALVADSKETSESDQVPEMVEKMAKTFSQAQIGLLIEMLNKVQPAEQFSQPIQHQPAAVYEEEDPSVLRGNLEKALVAAPDIQSYKMLITDDDSNDSYVPRPTWAKAVCEDSKRLQENESDEQDLELIDLLTVPRSNLSDFDLIGEGQFGQVFKATLHKGAEVMEVAVKTTKGASTAKDKENFLREMRIMSVMMHPNIVRLYGLVQDDVVSPWIVLEFLPHGDLKSFLMKNKRPVQQLVKYMVDISMGMHYLSERGLIHRDLAARNVLVGQNEMCKVADFGLLRELPKDDSIYHMQTSVPCPVRWMPPESISQRKFSAASDVWSYGVLLWEIFNPRKMPYEKYSNIEVATKVIQGYRMPVPRVCPPVVVRIMKACWHNNPDKRPSFLLISTLLTTKCTFY